MDPGGKIGPELVGVFVVQGRSRVFAGVQNSLLRLDPVENSQATAGDSGRVHCHTDPDLIVVQRVPVANGCHTQHL